MSSAVDQTSSSAAYLAPQSSTVIFSESGASKLKWKFEVNEHYEENVTMKYKVWTSRFGEHENIVAEKSQDIARMRNASNTISISWNLWKITKFCGFHFIFNVHFIFNELHS